MCRFLLYGKTVHTTAQLAFTQTRIYIQYKSLCIYIYTCIYIYIYDVYYGSIKQVGSFNHQPGDDGWLILCHHQRGGPWRHLLMLLHIPQVEYNKILSVTHNIQTKRRVNHRDTDVAWCGHNAIVQNCSTYSTMAICNRFSRWSTVTIQNQ